MPTAQDDPFEGHDSTGEPNHSAAMGLDEPPAAIELSTENSESEAVAANADSSASRGVDEQGDITPHSMGIEDWPDPTEESVVSPLMEQELLTELEVLLRSGGIQEPEEMPSIEMPSGDYHDLPGTERSTPSSPAVPATDTKCMTRGGVTMSPGVTFTLTLTLMDRNRNLAGVSDGCRAAF